MKLNSPPSLNSLSSLDERFKMHALEDQDRIKESIEDCIKQVQFLMDYGDYDLSSHLLSFILKENPHHTEALSLISVCFKAMNEPHRILFTIKKIMKFSEWHFKEGLFYADLLLEHQLRGEAKSIYFSLLKRLEVKEHSIQDKDILFTLYMRIGDLYLQELDFEQAKNFYFKAKKVNPQDDTLWVRLGSLSCQRQDFEKALFYFREALAKNKKNDLAWFGLSLVHRFYGDYELSWANLEQALDTHFLNERALHVCFSWAKESPYGGYRLIKILERVKSNQKDKEIQMRVGLLLARAFYDLGQYENSLSEVNEIMKGGRKCKGIFTLKVLLKEAFKQRESFSQTLLN